MIMNFGFCKRLRIPWLYKCLLVEKELCFMQLHKMDHTSFQRCMLFWTIAILRHLYTISSPSGFTVAHHFQSDLGRLVVEAPRSPLNEWSASRRGRYLHNAPKRRTSMPSAGFETATTKIEQPQTYAFDRTATGISPIPCCIFIIRGLEL